jgi:sugar phosphate isomerase/epimerase
MRLGQLASSAGNTPTMPAEAVFPRTAALGLRKFEVYSLRAASRPNLDADPALYKALGDQHGLRFSSMHLPPINDDFDAALARAIHVTRFAAAIGAPVVLFKATSRAHYIKAAGPFLDAVTDLPVTPVLQNHVGSAISTLDDYRAVIEGIADRRMKGLLEVGHFHCVGTHWREAYELLKDMLTLVHVKDQVGRMSVPFGTGEIDIVGLFRHLTQIGYGGDVVIEMSVKDQANTFRYLAEALDYLNAHCLATTDA